MALTNKLINIANAIREKTGKSDPLTLDSMVEAIESISAGGGDAQSVLDSLIDRSITEITNNVTSIGKYAFQNCSNLTSVDFPLVMSIDNGAFYNCSNLISVYFPLVTSIGQSAFSGCSNLTSVNFPLATSTGTYAFESCSKLTSVDFPLAARVAQNSFYGCYRLKVVILRSDTLCTLTNTNAFSKCYHFHGTVHTTHNPDGLKDGYIYVPAALIEDYKVATNWSEFATQFRALEDYTVDGTTIGALDESKI